MKSLWISFVVVVINLALCGHVVGQEPKKVIQTYTDPQPYKKEFSCNNPECLHCGKTVFTVERKAQIEVIDDKQVKILNQEVTIMFDIEANAVWPARKIKSSCWGNREKFGGRQDLWLTTDDAEIHFQVTATLVEGQLEISAKLVKYVVKGQDVTQATTANFEANAGLMSHALSMIECFNFNNTAAFRNEAGQLQLGYAVEPAFAFLLTGEDLSALAKAQIADLIAKPMQEEALKPLKKEQK